MVHGFSPWSARDSIAAVRMDRWRAKRWYIFTWFLASALGFALRGTFPLVTVANVRMRDSAFLNVSSFQN